MNLGIPIIVRYNVFYTMELAVQVSTIRRYFSFNDVMRDFQSYYVSS